MVTFADDETAGTSGDGSYTYTPIVGATCRSVTSHGFKGKAPLFLKPAMIFTGVKDKDQALPRIPAMPSVVITLHGLVDKYL